MTIEPDTESASRPATVRRLRPQSPNTSGDTRARMPLVLTNSRIGSYMACPRRHWWAYELGIRREQDSARLNVGRAYHNAIECINHGGTLEAAATLARAPELVDEVDREITACIVSGWHWRWSEHPTGKIIASEKVFEFKPNPRALWSLAGKIDAIAELPDGRLAVVEYKTAGEDIGPGSDYWRRLTIDRQISVYMLGARALGYDVQTVVYDAARLPGMRPKLTDRKSGARETMEQYAARVMESIAEKPDWYYGRHEIPRTEADIDETREELAEFAELIRNARAKDRWPRNTDACRRWGTCPYFGPCVDSFDPETQGIPNGYTKIEDVNAELTVNGTSIMETDHDSADHSAAVA